MEDLIICDNSEGTGAMLAFLGTSVKSGTGIKSTNAEGNKMTYYSEALICEQNLQFPVQAQASEHTKKMGIFSLT